MTASWAKDPFGRRLITSAMRVSVSELSSIWLSTVLFRSFRPQATGNSRP
jgi:hypothetical protein